MKHIKYIVLALILIPCFILVDLYFKFAEYYSYVVAVYEKTGENK